MQQTPQGTAVKGLLRNCKSKERAQTFLRPYCPYPGVMKSAQKLCGSAGSVRDRNRSFGIAILSKSTAHGHSPEHLVSELFNVVNNVPDFPPDFPRIFPKNHNFKSVSLKGVPEAYEAYLFYFIR